jgi:hypothetical protein
MEIEKRSIDDLIALYELEPSIRDIYVEGKFDKCLIEWFLSEFNQSNYAIYDVDTVDIPAASLFSQGLLDNNRSRVIFLAIYIHRRLPTTKSLTCIADKDFSFLLGGEEFDCPFLLFTDYTSIDIYLFNEVVLDKFFCLVVRLPKLTAKDILSRVSYILEELFLIRATNQALDLGMQWLEFTRCCNHNSGNIEFQTEDFIERYLNKNSKLAEKQIFKDKITELRTNSNLLDVRCKIRGKDFIEILCFYIKNYLPNSRAKFADPEVIQGSLLGCLNASLLAQENLFQQLLRILV